MPVNLKLSIPCTHYYNMYYHQLVKKIKTKYVENFRTVPHVSMY
jgi:hypothetical protein